MLQHESKLLFITDLPNESSTSIHVTFMRTLKRRWRGPAWRRCWRCSRGWRCCGCVAWTPSRTPPWLPWGDTSPASASSTSRQSFKRKLHYVLESRRRSPQGHWKLVGAYSVIVKDRINLKKLGLKLSLQGCRCVSRTGRDTLDSHSPHTTIIGPRAVNNPTAKI